MSLEIVDASELVRNVGYAHNAATTAKAPIVINSKVYIPLNTADADERNAFVHEALIKGAAKTTGEAWSFGSALYWNDSTKKLTTTSSGNTLCGYALEAKLSGDTTGGLVHFRSF